MVTEQRVRLIVSSYRCSLNLSEAARPSTRCSTVARHSTHRHRLQPRRMRSPDSARGKAPGPQFRVTLGLRRESRSTACVAPVADASAASATDPCGAAVVPSQQRTAPAAQDTHGAMIGIARKTGLQAGSQNAGLATNADAGHQPGGKRAQRGLTPDPDARHRFCKTAAQSPRQSASPAVIFPHHRVPARGTAVAPDEGGERRV